MLNNSIINFKLNIMILRSNVEEYERFGYIGKQPLINHIEYKNEKS